jgi:hypothetical protein
VTDPPDRDIDWYASQIHELSDNVAIAAEWIDPVPTPAERRWTVVVPAGPSFVVGSLLDHGNGYSAQEINVNDATVTIDALTVAEVVSPVAQRLWIRSHLRRTLGRHTHEIVGALVYVLVRDLGDRRTTVTFVSPNVDKIWNSFVEPLITGLDRDFPGVVDCLDDSTARRAESSEPLQLHPVSFAVAIDSDVEAVKNSLRAASHDIPSDGNVTYGRLRRSGHLESRIGEERFEVLMELPETIRAADRTETSGALILIGVRRLSERRSKVWLVGLNAYQTPVIRLLAERLAQDYP